ncbi:16S rRNA (guanine(966)-N(2))-methyltransferase RsmD [Spiribacter insolitus]|uniref:Ribosomal RNA small subunit methyltransferase D n=1 Tax=Spiribacter insolitus TaxID=3122417 RepID=A0ABV3T7S6_9GAMM
MAGQLRIIGGEWRGRRFPVAQASGLRPTADRNRETLFNWLQGDIKGARVLDLFAGTGALGLEALSRGAENAVFVEKRRPVAQSLQALIRRLEAGIRAEVVMADARRYLERPLHQFDLVFLDPPFRVGLLPGVVEQLQRGGWLVPGASVYVESGIEETPLSPPDDWSCRREKTAGGVCYRLFQAGG